MELERVGLLKVAEDCRRAAASIENRQKDPLKAWGIWRPRPWRRRSSASPVWAGKLSKRWLQNYRN